MSNTTATNNSEINLPKFYIIFGNLNHMLTRFTNPYIFVVACIGLITNTSTIVLLSKSFLTKNLRHRWTLVALALSDLVHNFALLIRVLQGLMGGKNQYYCIIISFLSHLAELLSACFTVLFTIQRYAAVRYPFQAAFQNQSLPIISLLLIFVSSVIFCSLLSYANECVGGHEELELIWFIADALSSFIIPFSLILIFNILIVSLIRKHGRSAITTQSTLSRSDKSNKNNRRHDSNKSNTHEKSYSVIYSYACQSTLQGTISETDIDKKLNSTNSLNRNDENNTSTNEKKPMLLFTTSDETEFLTNETYIPMLPMEIMSSDVLSINHPRSSDQSTEPQRGDKKNKNNTLSDSYESREFARLSNDMDYISAKEGQTTQSIRVTRMLVIVSTCFLILNAPAHICLIATKIYSVVHSHGHGEHIELDSSQQTVDLTNNQLRKYGFSQTNNGTMPEKTHSLSNDTEISVDNISIHVFYMAVFFTQLISYASYSINFFLYSYSGVAFRTSFKQFFSKLRRH